MSIFIIAEIGINHNGDVEIAKDLVKVAKNAGCDAVKFQKRAIELVYPSSELEKPRESPWGTTNRQQKEGLEFGQREFEQISNFCKQLDIEWFASAWDPESQKFLRQFDCKFNKIASAMMVDEAHLELVASEGRHTFVSTGMSTLEEIDKAVQIFNKSNCPFELMHCVSTYPMEDTDANLNCIHMLRERYGCNVGYSGHEVGLAVSYAAAALGISSLERHITLDRSMWGTDQAASLEEQGMRTLSNTLQKAPNLLGNGIKKFDSIEKKMLKKFKYW